MIKNMRTTLFGVTLPNITKLELIDSLARVRKNSKQTLYFFYSEFLLRANRNPFYKQVLNSANHSAIDGRGLHWAQYRIQQKVATVRFYQQFALALPTVIRLVLFVILFFAECVSTALSVTYNLISKVDFGQKVSNELILGRDFVYNLFEIGQKKKWNTLIIGGNVNNTDIIRSQIIDKFPKLKLDFWAKKYDSHLMRDEYSQEFKDQMQTQGFVLNTENLLTAFPELKEARDYIQKTSPDLIIFCLGGQSGKQEFFIDYLKHDAKVSFSLATGVGAALDHLGAGAQQEKPPVWLTQAGLEWVFRFIKQPYRRQRIWDSIFTLWWWVTLEQFYIGLEYRRTIVNVIFRKALNSKGREYLLLRRKNWLPGDVAWTFAQGGVDKGEVLEMAGLRETKEETDLDNWDLQILKPAFFVNREEYVVSLGRFMALEGLYKGSKNYLNIMQYTGTKVAKVNWENLELRWFESAKVEQYLSQEKREIWRAFLK
jgi:UDP-N-acetyl-D-mannosaminuronic acid transferase (WecB/TagA/CpsF family)/ADP-ribose pyrophosphatase YjhB (NUDIX family)